MQQHQRSKNEKEAGTLRVRSEELLAGHSRLIIVHEGKEYQLLKTRRGKLILTR